MFQDSALKLKGEGELLLSQQREAHHGRGWIRGLPSPVWTCLVTSSLLPSPEEVRHSCGPGEGGACSYTLVP